MRGFELLPVYPEGKVVAYANVYGGNKPSVGLVGKDKIDLLRAQGRRQLPDRDRDLQRAAAPAGAAGPGDRQAQCLLRRQAGADRRRSMPPRRSSRATSCAASTDAAKQLLLGWLP